MINKTTKKDLYSIDPRAIVVVDGFNSRSDFGDISELARQIDEQGMLNPISVQDGGKREDGTTIYKLVDGERRYRAVMQLISEGKDIARVPAILVSKSLSEADLLIQQGLRNEGKNFNEYEWGQLAYKLRENCGFTIAEIAKRLGKNQGVVTYWLQILEMDTRLQEAVRDNVISGSNLRRMLQANNKNQDAVVAELEKLKANAEEKGEKKVKLVKHTDIDLTTKTVIYRDSKAILKGMETLYSYIAKIETKYGKSKALNLDMQALVERLKNENVDVILESMLVDAPTDGEVADAA
ncbi:MAG: ParB/RepB/Spo0J family partition protein [bacterium]|nr:ParB/RepB/Spo0J family partition protein [bacterium]